MDKDLLPSSNRKFYDLSEGMKSSASQQNTNPTCENESENDSVKSANDPTRSTLLSYVEQNVIGRDKIFSGPFGYRTVTYCDYVASGRGLQFIEDYIQAEVLPDYGNTHTTTTVTSLQTTLFRHEARDIIRHAVNASERDAVIFAGAGTTAAVHKLIHGLRLNRPPVVFVGPYEHHSAFLPWHGVGATVVRINLHTGSGAIDLQHLQVELKKWRGSRRPLIGMFSAASNVTGVVTSVDPITVLLHKHGALAFWDYATAGPYVRVDMNPVIASTNQPYVYKDAIFISPHKFIGGVGTPGLLIAKKSLFENSTPSDCGGGSVFFVRRNGHRYLQEVEMREEGGTPDIVGSIRAGLCFQLKDAISSDVIMERERHLYRLALSRWSSCENLVLLGYDTCAEVDRLPIFSFLIKHPSSGLFLHHNFVCALLNDMFGVQTRGGCACAGPYAQDLLGIDEDTAIRIENLLVEDSRLDRTHLRRYREYSSREILRPGFSRLNLTYFMADDDVEFVLDAVAMIAQHGWKMLPQYIFNPETGDWRHSRHQVFKDRKWLGFIKYTSGKMAYQQTKYLPKATLPHDKNDCLNRARKLFEEANKFRVDLADQAAMFDGEADVLRWFLLPSEAWHCLRHQTGHIRSLPFWPGRPVQQVDYLDELYQILPDEEIGKPPFCNEDNSLGKEEEISRLSILGNEKSRKFSEVVCEEMNAGFWQPIKLRQGCQNGCNAQGCQNCFSDSGDVLLITCQTSSSNLVSHQPSTCQTSSHLPSTCQTSSSNPVSDQPSTCQTSSSNPVSDEPSMCQTSSSNPVSDQPSTCQTSSSNPVSDQPSTCQTSSSNPVSDQPNTCQTSSPNQVSQLPGEDESSGGGDALPETTPSITATVLPQSPGVYTSPDVKPSIRWESPPKKIFSPTVEALRQSAMIRDGDRVLVGLSGGKDSISLLHTLHQYQFVAAKNNISFTIGAVTVDPKTPSYDPSSLKTYLAALGVPYFYEEQDILRQAADLPYECASICSFCSRMKRGRIYACARRENYNVVALGQHLDDAAESLLMNIFHNGLLRTMKSNYIIEDGGIRVIRPLIHVREIHLRQFAEQRNLPVIAENCPACFEAPKERHRMKQLLAGQEVMFPYLFSSLRAAMEPLTSITIPGVSVKAAMDSYLQILSNTDRSEVVDHR